MKTILIVGGSGFMGANFTEYFVNNGYKVISYSNSPTRIQHENVVNVCGDSRDTQKIESIFVEHKVDKVIFTLTSFWVVDGVSSYQDLTAINLSAFIDVLAVMKRHAVNDIIYISSGGSIYGESNEPIPEDAPLLPVSFYGWIKEAAESYLKYEARINPELRYLIFRPSNVYGKYQQLNRIIGVALKNTHLDVPMNIFGGADTKKDYIYIDDFCEIIFKILEKDIWNETYNIGSGVGTSIREILDIAQEVVQKPLAVEYGKQKEGDISYSVLNVDKVKSATGKQQFITVKEGMAKMYPYVVEELERLAKINK
ncbi:NAD-dependent epimerase/dehydratase family protein [Franconibacter helveticus]|uniref:NAD-dependent epimerase/dehydratase family protein n=1 Tax=Franconibacter helveticus TaxID=357240 RepID=UPI00066D9D29|nr:NAD-dependent epimerase/dehydratase family protein [Franconibacter helveticus]